MADAWRLKLSALILAGAFAVPTLAQESQQAPPAADGVPWRILLEQQLMRDKSCDVDEVLMFDEFTRNNEVVLEGRVSCIDGRHFDFKRPHPHQKFELDLCKPAVC